MNARHQARPAKIIAIVAVVALTAVGVAAGPATTAVAVTSSVPPVIQRSASAVTADALPTVQINGVVWDQAIAGDTVFAGGEFTSARPAGAAAGTNETPRSNLLSYNITTGVMNAGFAPVVNGRVRTMAVSPDGKRVYVGGAFTTVDGQNRYRIAAFDTATGSLVSSFAPVIGSDVFSIAVTSKAVYLGGWFKSVNGVARERLAAVDPSTGALLGWAPTADNTVYGLAVTGDGTKIFAAGSFGNLNGAFNPGLGSFDAGNGTLLPTAATSTVQNYGNSAGFYSVKINNGRVFATGFWFGGTGNFEGMISLDPATGAIVTMADCHGDVYDVSPAGDTVYTVSHQHYCVNIGGYPDPNPRARWMRANAFSLDAAGTVRHNGQANYTDFYGQPAPSIVNWFPDVAVGTYTGQSQGGWTTESNGKYVVQGGEFPLVNNKAQQGLVRFAIPSLAPNVQGPRVSGTALAVNLTSIGDTQVRVSWPADYDRDDQVLRYELLRVGNATPIFTTTATSQFWDRPTISFVDTGLTPGASYSYYLRVYDPTGNRVSSTPVEITTGSDTVDQTTYATKVLADGASHFWRFDQKAGAVNAVDWAPAGQDLDLGAGVSNGVAGAITGSTDTAASFSGAGTGTGSAGQPSPSEGPDTFSVEAWFKSTSVRGGKIIGFGSQPSGGSLTYDRHIYLSKDGRVVFGVASGGAQTLSTGTGLNDGKWHHVVGELSSAGLQLYVDGQRIGTLAKVTSGQRMVGYWRVGGDTVGSAWPYTPTTGYLAGSIDEVAVYPTALSGNQVRDHFTASGRTVSAPAAPTDAYGKAVYGSDPDLYWRLDDTTGTTVADVTPSRFDGTVSGTVTRGTVSPVTSPGTAMTFDGSTGSLSSNLSLTAPNVFSQELWFATTSTKGGKLIGFGNAQTGSSTAYDRHVYLSADGKINFGVNPGTRSIATSPKAYNDGAWHQVVSTLGANGMKLYVDGRLVASTAATGGQALTGYWRVGGDASWSGAGYLAGSIDEVSVFPVVLSPEQVAQHYYASPNAINAVPKASFTKTCTGTDCSFDASASTDSDGSISAYAWDFGDGATGTGRTVSHGYAKSGTFTVKLTATDNGGATASTTADVTVVRPNAKPTAAFTTSAAGLKVTADASTSADSDGTVATYAWDFGDNLTDTGKITNHTYAAEGTYSVKLTVTDDLGATDVITKQVSVTKPSPILATDTFTRSGSRWGTADTGGSWTDSGATQFATNGSKGVLTLTKAGSSPTASLDGVSAADLVVESDLALDKVPDGGGAYYYTDARRTTDGRYVMYVRVLADGSVRVGLRTLVGSTETTLKEATVAGVTYTPGTVLHSRLEVSGTGTTTLTGRVWKDGAAAPVNPQVSTTDTTTVLQKPGAIGLRGYLSASSTTAPVTVTVDNLSAKTLSQ